MEKALSIVLDEALAVHEGFRRLGFEADDLFLGSDSEKVVVILRTQDKEFVVACGFIETTEEALAQAWNEKVHRWNDPDGMTNSERAQLFETSNFSSMAIPLLAGLIQKGIRLPASATRPTQPAPNLPV